MSGSAATNTAILNERITRVDDALVELKTLVTGIDNRMREYERHEAACQAVVQSNTNAAHRRLDEQARNIEQIDKRLFEIEVLIPSIKELIAIKPKLFTVATVGGFIGTAVGGLVVAFLFKLLTG